MEEKVLVKSKKYEVKKLFKIMVIIGAILSLICSFAVFSDEWDYYSRWYGDDHEHDSFCYKYTYRDDFYDDEDEGNLEEYKMDCEQVVYGNPFSYAIAEYFSNMYFLLCLIPLAILAVVGGVIYLWLRGYELTVTDKRIYGTVAWGKRVDLPVDSVSAIATNRILKGVSVSTASGRIGFFAIKNVDEIYDVINKLLVDRQQVQAKVATTAVESKNDEMEQLKKLKELLDSGILTQDEFDAKKKQILGL